MSEPCCDYCNESEGYRVTFFDGYSDSCFHPSCWRKDIHCSKERQDQWLLFFGCLPEQLDVIYTPKKG